MALNSLSFLVKMTIMGWVVVVVQGRYMLFIPAGFHFRFASSVLGIALLGLSACQPVFQAQTGRTVPVVFPAESQTGPVSQAENEADDLTPSSTLLTEEEASAEPVEATAVLIPHKDPVQDDQTPVQSESQTDEAVIVISRSPPPAQPVVLPAFNPADLVGKSQSFVNAQFGQADFSRTEGVIHVLQYRQPDCVIDLFISVAGTSQTPPPAEAKIIDWAMRERTVNQALDLTLCQQQFFDRKL